MSTSSVCDRLELIDTLWPLVRDAHDAAASDTRGARHELLRRYGKAAYRYLVGALRDEEAAKEQYQEFVLRLLRGDFHRAVQKRGRFRDYLRKALVHLATDHHRTRRGRPRSLPDQMPAPLAGRAGFSEDLFLDSWRRELLHRAWKSLGATHPGYAAVLRIQRNSPDASAAEKAEFLAQVGGSPFTANGFRVQLHRARRKYLAMLIEEVKATVGDENDVALIKELHALGLWSHYQRM